MPLQSTLIAPVMTSPPDRPAIQLRDYQRDAISHIKAAVRSGERRIYFTLPTGAGKSVVLTAVIDGLAQHGRVLVIAHRRDLIDQLRGHTDRLAHRVGTVMAEQDDTGARVIVASVASLTMKRLTRIMAASPDPIAAIIVDESHHITPSSRYATVIDGIAATYPGVVVIGCTATPFRADKQRMQDVLPRCVFARDIADMQAAGYLVDLCWRRAVTMADFSQIATARIDGDTDYATHALAVVVDTPDVIANVVAQTVPIIGDRVAVAFAVNVAHAQHLAVAYHAAGMRAAAAWGDMPRQDRDQVIAAWKAGDLQMVVNCALFTEGFDFPAIAAVVMARPTMSLNCYMQMIGRGTRPAPGKTDALIIDVAGNADRTDPRQIVLPDVVPVADDDVAVALRQRRPSPLRKTGVRPRTMMIRNPLADDVLLWSVDEATQTYHLPLDECRTMALVRDPGGSGLYRAGVLKRETLTDATGMRRYRQSTIPILTTGCPLIEATHVACSWAAKHAELWVARRDQPWRKDMPTEKQIIALQAMAPDLGNLARRGQMTRGEVAEAMTQCIFRRAIPQVTTDLWQSMPRRAIGA